MWENAGTAASPIPGPYSPADFAVGNWGVDTSTHQAWVVLAGGNSGEFAVTIVPEPASLLLMGLGALLLGLRPRRRAA